MGISFNPKEMLASIANYGIVAFCMANGMSSDQAAAMGGIAEGGIKGIEVHEKPLAIFEELEQTTKQAIHQTLQVNELEHLPGDFENKLYENAFSINSIKKYCTIDNPVELLKNNLRNVLISSETYDLNTLPLDSLCVSLIENVYNSIQNNHELTVLSTYYTVNEINNALHSLIPSVSEFEAAILNMKPISEYATPNRLHFLNEKIGFYGRVEEFLWLDHFRDLPKPLLYAMIHGCSGAGKSRLLYEYIKQHNNEADWHLCFLNDNLITSLMDFNSYECSKNLLVVIDYAGRFSDLIGKWILKLAESKETTNKIRIVLIERQGLPMGTDLTNIVPWIQNFYGSTHQSRILKELEYGSLTVSQLDKLDLFQIMDDYAAKVIGKPILSNEKKEQIYEFVSTELNNELSRQTPLFILLATDSFLCEGSIRNWDIHLLAQGYVDRMLEYWLEAFCQKDKILFGSLLKILVIATAIGGIDLNESIPDFITDELNVIIQNTACRTIFENTCGLNEEIVLPIQPDYIGELVFLQYLSKLFPSKKQQDFLDSLYYKPAEFMSFFVRCIDDFAHSDMFKPLFDKIVDLIKPTCKTLDNYMAFTFIIANFALQASQTKRHKCADALDAVFADKMVQDSPYADNIGYLYSSILANMTYVTGYDRFTAADFSKIPEWSLSIARDSVEKLRNLYNNYLHISPSILLPFTQALANCSIYDTYIEAQQCADELRVLYEKYCSTEPGISVSYAMALNNIVYKIQNTGDITLANCAEDAVHKLSKLYDKHVLKPSNYSDIAVCFINAVSDTELRELLNEQLKKVNAEMHMRQVDVGVEYAKALNNIIGLYVITSNNKAADHFKSLTKIYEVHKNDNVKITIEYAKGIVAIITLCKKDNAEHMLNILRELCLQYQNDKAIFNIFLMRYVKAIHNRLAIAVKSRENDDGFDWMFSELVTIYNCYKDLDPELVPCCVRSIFYMFAIKLRNNQVTECKSLLENMVNMRNSSDSAISNIADNYIALMTKLLSQ